MRRTKEDAEKTKQQLLQAAIITFKQKGYKAANLTDIAEEANVTRGAIAWHFTNKECLYKELIQKRIQDSKEDMAMVMKMELPPDKTIMAFVDYLVSNRHSMSSQISILNNLIKEKPKEFTELYDQVKAHFSYIIQKLKSVINQGIEEKTFKQNLNHEFTAKAIYTFLWGFLTDFEILYSDYTEEELKKNIKGFFRQILMNSQNTQ